MDWGQFRRRFRWRLCTRIQQGYLIPHSLGRTLRDRRDPGVERCAPGPIILCLFRAVSADIIDGLGLVAAPFVDLSALFPFASVEGCSRVLVSVSGRTNMPRRGGQSKYLWPWTVPSFLPLSSSSSMPIQWPVEKCVVPTNRTIPCLPSVYWILVPGESPAIWRSRSGIEHLAGSDVFV